MYNFSLLTAICGFKVLNTIKPHKIYCIWWNCHRGSWFHLLVLVSSSSGCRLFQNTENTQKKTLLFIMWVISKTENKAVMWDKNILTSKNLLCQCASLFLTFLNIHTLYPFHISQGVLWLVYFSSCAFCFPAFLFIRCYQKKMLKGLKQEQSAKIKFHEKLQTTSSENE